MLFTSLAQSFPTRFVYKLLIEIKRVPPFTILAASVWMLSSLFINEIKIKFINFT